MKHVITFPSETTVKVEFVLEPIDLSDANLVALRFLGNDTKVKGFRKGKAPISILAKHIEPSKLHDKVIDVAVNKAIGTCFIENKLHALDRPQVEFKKYVPGEILEFTAEVEVLPKVQLGNYRRLVVDIKPRNITANDINSVIMRMLDSLAEKVAVDRQAQDGDEVVIDFIGKKDNQAFIGGTAKDYKLSLGSNSMIAGFEQGIIGKKPNQTFDLELMFPVDYHAQHLKGANVVFTVTLKQVNQKQLPKLNDDFAKRVGPFNTLVELKNDIKRELSEQENNDSIIKKKNALVAQLVKISNFSIPKILISDQIQALKRDFIKNLNYQGTSIENYLKDNDYATEEDWQKKELEAEAKRRVEEGLVLAQLSSEMDIQITDLEIDNQIAQFKTQYQKDQSFASQFDSEDVRRNIANNIRTRKTIDQLYELNS